VGFLLGKNELVVHFDLEDPAGSLDELGPDAELSLDLFRQTGGSRVVVSDGAVLDGDVRGHGLLLSGRHYKAAAEKVTGTLEERNEMTGDPVFSTVIGAAEALNGTKAAGKFSRDWISGVTMSTIEIVQHCCTVSLIATLWRPKRDPGSCDPGASFVPTVPDRTIEDT